MSNNDQLLAAVIEQTKKIEEMSSDLKDHIEDEESLIKQFKKAFPDGDLEGHKRYHQTLIDEAEARKEFYQEFAKKAAQAGLLGAIGWIAMALWTMFKMEVKS